MSDIKVTIDGLTDSPHEYDDEKWLEADNNLTQAVSEFYETGATVSNIEDAVKNGLENVEAAA